LVPTVIVGVVEDGPLVIIIIIIPVLVMILIVNGLLRLLLQRDSGSGVSAPSYGKGEARRVRRLVFLPVRAGHVVGRVLGGVDVKGLWRFLCGALLRILEANLLVLILPITDTCGVAELVKGRARGWLLLVVEPILSRLFRSNLCQRLELTPDVDIV
jgi:hypothetical protein